MPDFLKDYIAELHTRSERIKAAFTQSRADSELREAFKKHWISSDLTECKPDLSVMAIDSSSARLVTSNGGIFYVIRALGLSRKAMYRKVVTDYDFTSDTSHELSYILNRMSEWLEHVIAVEAVNDNFEGFILLDGSIYGRLAHIPIETGFENNRGFMIKYFETITVLLDLCRRRNVPVIGISKESRTPFFREFLIKKILSEMKDKDQTELERLISMALNDRGKAIEEAEKLNDATVCKLIKELIQRKPDFHLILNFAESSGYTAPLLLGASLRRKRDYDMIARNPEEFILSKFSLSSRSEEFVEYASKVAKDILKLPAIMSFHLRPSKNDTPMRIDVPAWFFGIDKKMSEVEWHETADVDLENILKLISSGYCGLDNYNIWLTAVDSEVKLRRDIFESLYLPRFEEIVGRFATPRGYRRVRYP